MLKVREDRLWNSLLAMAEIGATPQGGCCRLALSEEDAAGRALFASWCKEAGCEVYHDEIGNVFARRAGTAVDVPAVMCGSHLDTQPLGGRFDGVYGVLAGLELVRALNERGIKTKHPIEVVVWTNEEGARFSPGMMGSAVYSGKLDLERALSQQCSQTGAKVGDELRRWGIHSNVPISPRPKAYFEAHIEQGPVLECASLPIGVVTGVQGICWLQVVVGGFESHAGTTPMSMRRDAMAAAARMITAVLNVAAEDGPHARATVGRIACRPNSTSTIPGRVEFTVDLRHPSARQLHDMSSAITTRCKQVATETNATVEVRHVFSFDPVAFDTRCVDRVRRAAADLGLSSMDILSGAGHDAAHIAHVAPAAMIFVPCKAGLSHNELEDADPLHLAQGASVLANAVLAEAVVDESEREDE